MPSACWPRHESGSGMTIRLLATMRQVCRPADLWTIPELRYLLVGGFNTLVGYGLGVGLYLALADQLHILVIGVIANILANSVSFTTYKYLVFRSQGRWLVEYLRSYLVYGGSALVGIMLLWLLVDGLRLPIWLAQGLAMLITVVASYLGHDRITFRNPPPRPRREMTRRNHPRSKKRTCKKSS